MRKPDKTWRRTKDTLRRHQLAIIVVTSVTAIAGWALLSYARAETFVVAVEAEQGAKSGNSVAGDTAGASGGASVKFTAASVTPPVQTARKLKIMPLGDSITLGNYYAGAYRVSLWDKLVNQDKLQVDFVGSASNGPSSLGDKDVQAISGIRTDQLNSSITGWLRTYTPDVVLVQTGSSDLEQGASAATTASRLDTLTNTMLTQNPKLMIVLSTTTPEEIGGKYNTQPFQDYDKAIPGIVNKYKAQGKLVYLADMVATNFSFGPPDIGDGTHPTATGYLKMTAVWYPVVKPLFYTTP